jgi:hypothetical protein
MSKPGLASADTPEESVDYDGRLAKSLISKYCRDPDGIWRELGPLVTTNTSSAWNAFVGEILRSVGVNSSSEMAEADLLLLGLSAGLRTGEHSLSAVLADLGSALASRGRMNLAEAMFDKAIDCVGYGKADCLALLLSAAHASAALGSRSLYDRVSSRLDDRLDHSIREAGEGILRKFDLVRK